jgi:hypothetical protein
MSIEHVLDKLADAINRNTDAALKIHNDQFTAGTTPAKSKTITASSDPIETTEEKPAPKKKAAKKKAAQVEEKPKETEPTPEPEVEDDEDDTPSTATMDDVRTAAMKVRDEVSKDALTAVKKAFKINGVKELGEENFAAFVRHCDDVVARGEDV